MGALTVVLIVVAVVILSAAWEIARREVRLIHKDESTPIPPEILAAEKNKKTGGQLPVYTYAQWCKDMTGVDLGDYDGYVQ